MPGVCVCCHVCVRSDLPAAQGDEIGAKQSRCSVLVDL